ncbi:MULTISPECIES: hypothetical protein [Bacillus cereus group]|uniref:hypothetical protein n=1 Tax=Bacillus cereus group TaxID=86661 RepID=UPI00159BC25A|nr:hypothetical protein [Bacillus thuringiensis]MCQ6335058.1 hypothetical protein [Bacillus cereus]
MFILRDKFEKSWDTIWTSSLGSIGTVIGSGGLVGSRVAVEQVNAQVKTEEDKQ